MLFSAKLFSLISLIPNCFHSLNESSVSSLPRLFLTMEISPKIPVNLLRAGRILVFEPPPGIRANLLRTFSSVRTTVTAAQRTLGSCSGHVPIVLQDKKITLGHYCVYTIE